MLGKLSPQQVRILQEKENKSSSEAVRSSLDIDDEYDIPDWLSSASDMTIAIRQQQQSTSTERSFIPPQFLSTVQYNLQDAIESTSSFMNTVGILLYTPKSNQFKMYYNTKDMKWAASCRKLSLAFKEFVMLLRHEFPTRFQQDEDELAIVISGGDYPKLSRNCLLSFPNTSDECISHKTPILQFGSVFRPPTYSQSLPNMLMMPMSATHLTCFTQYGISNKEKVCDSFSEKTPNAKRYMVFGDGTSTKFEVRVSCVWLMCLCACAYVMLESRLLTIIYLFSFFLHIISLQDLIPQVVWRGTDFGYMGNHINANLRRPTPKEDIDDKIKGTPLDFMNPQEKKAAATAELLKIYDDLIPRWKGVVLTAKAEVEAQDDQEEQQDDNNVLPWANIKFTTTAPVAKDDAKAEFAKLDEYINSKGERMSLEGLAQYKYHIDMGGGGGTTWTGTMTKMAMPGLLFHHMTPTKDYIHEYMKPWIHYVPIKADLSDLREKYEWAESHPEAAEMIASQGSDLMRYLGTPHGFGEMYQDVFVDQVRQVIEAYQPVSKSLPGSSLEEVLESHEELVVKSVCTTGHDCVEESTDGRSKALIPTDYPEHIKKARAEKAIARKLWLNNLERKPYQPLSEQEQ